MYKIKVVHNAKKTHSFNDEMSAFLNDGIIKADIDNMNDSISDWKNYQFDVLAKTQEHLANMSILYKNEYNDIGPFDEIGKTFEILNAELQKIIESEKDSLYGLSVAAENSIRCFFSKLASFVNDSVIKIQVYKTNIGITDIHNIFLVHGPEFKYVKKIEKNFACKSIHLVVLESQTQMGLQFVYEKLVEQSNKCGVAIILLISENTQEPVFRPNVLFELGYFLGKLGREHVIIVSNCNEDKMPSDIRGVYIIKTTKRNWIAEINKSLERMGIVL